MINVISFDEKLGSYFKIDFNLRKIQTFFLKEKQRNQFTKFNEWDWLGFIAYQIV